VPIKTLNAFYTQLSTLFCVSSTGSNGKTLTSLK